MSTVSSSRVRRYSSGIGGREGKPTPAMPPLELPVGGVAGRASQGLEVAAVVWWLGAASEDAKSDGEAVFAARVDDEAAETATPEVVVEGPSRSASVGVVGSGSIGGRGGSVTVPTSCATNM